MSVQDLISGAESRTQRFVSDADKAIDQAISLVKQIGYVAPDVSGAIAGIAQIGLADKPSKSLTALASLPEFEPVVMDPTTPVNPMGPTTPISPIVPGSAPVFTDVPLSPNEPTKPSALREFMGRAPVINTSVVLPAAPALIPVTAPDVTARTEPRAPQVMLPSFSATMPGDNVVAPTDLAGSFSAAYREAAPSTITMINGYVDAQLIKINPRYHEQMGAIESQLDKYLKGGTGLSTKVEDAIYNRARERNEVEAARARNAAWSEAASRGFTLPTGALVSSVARARQEGANNNAKSATDIAVAQAEMEQKNLQFAVTTSTGLRTSVINAMLSYMQNATALNGQAIEYSKTVLSSIIEMYNTSVKMYSAKLDAYKAEAAVYETRLKSAMAGVELYRVEVAALQAMTQVDHAKVEVYQARIAARGAEINVYKTQVEAVVAAASLEKLKLELFQSTVQAYGAEVQAKTAEWNGYSAAWQGEVAKSNDFRAKAEAFRAKVDGYKANIEGQAKVAEGIAMNNKSIAESYTAAVNAYSSEVHAKGEKARVEVQNQSQKVHAFQVKAQAELANAQAGVEYYRAVSSVALDKARVAMQAQIAEADSVHAFGQTVAQLGTANATIHANLASAAMSGINTLAGELKYE